MSDQELQQRAAAFVASIKAGRITVAKVEQALSGWIAAGFLDKAGMDTILAIIAQQ